MCCIKFLWLKVAGTWFWRFFTSGVPPFMRAGSLGPGLAGLTADVADAEARAVTTMRQQLENEFNGRAKIVFFSMKIRWGQDSVKLDMGVRKFLARYPDVFKLEGEHVSITEAATKPKAAALPSAPVIVTAAVGTSCSATRRRSCSLSV